jgi:2-amino-4-hydroxy-6-hydroxymethyldihydropteridine pyrophosphokinase
VIFLALGSNLGDREANLAEARRRLEERLGVDLVCSEVLCTEPVGFSGNEFLNQAVAFDSDIEPMELLGICQQIEREMGRERHEAQYDSEGRRIYHNRLIDIDILTYNELRTNSRRLTLPHPQCYDRPYVAAVMATFDEEILKFYKI